MTQDINFTLQPKQAQFWQHLIDKTTERICYGGGRRGGKSFVARAATLFRRCAYPGSVGLILRATEDEVIANHWEALQALARQWGVEFKANINDATITLPQFKHDGIPSKIFLGYGKSMDHVDRYQGNPYLDIFYDEATNLIEKMVGKINGSLANEHWPDTISKTFYTCNPGGIGTRWVLTKLVEEGPDRMPNTVFIQALVDDNQIFLQSDPGWKDRQRAELADQPHVLAAWIEGDWYASPNSYFAFDHKIGGKHLRVVEMPGWARIRAGLDYGYYPDPFAGVWWAKWKGRDAGDRIHAFSDFQQHRLELNEQAAAILAHEEMLRRQYPFFPPKVLRYTGADARRKIPSEKQEGLTRNIANIWRKNGLHTEAAKQSSRVEGWMLIRYFLKRGILTIDPGCTALIQEMKDAQHKKDAQGNLGADLNQSTGDHGLDSLRIGVYQEFWSSYAREISRLTVGIREDELPEAA